MKAHVLVGAFKMYESNAFIIEIDIELQALVLNLFTFLLLPMPGEYGRAVKVTLGW